MVPLALGSDRLEPLHQLTQANVYRPADGLQLDQVQPPLSRLVLADVGLMSAEPLGQLHLPQAGVGPQLPQDGDQALVLRGVDGLGHPGE